MPITYSYHVLAKAEERKLPLAWIERVVLAPDWQEQDSNHPGAIRVFRAIPEQDFRVLRVVYRPDGDDLHVITAFFDRRARRP
jgi:heat shock protein HspQ